MKRDVRQLLGWLAKLCSCTLAAACAISSPSPKNDPAVPPLGSAANPVKAYSLRGEREYLTRLRCNDGKAPAFGRVGTVGRGTDGHHIDRYLLQCEGSEVVVVFMDLYHTDHREQDPVPGFGIVPELPAAGATECPPPLPYPGYAFTDVEVTMPARLVSEPKLPLPENELLAAIEFVVGTDGMVETDSVRVLEVQDARPAASLAANLRRFRFSPGEHPAGCRVRQRVNGVFVLDRSVQ